MRFALSHAPRAAKPDGKLYQGDPILRWKLASGYHSRTEGSEKGQMCPHCFIRLAGTEWGYCGFETSSES